MQELEEKMGEAAFWNDQNAAHAVIEECNALKSWTHPYREIRERFDHVKEFLQEVDPATDPVFFEELVQEMNKVEEALSQLEVRRMLSGELDGKNCFLSINAGAGGTESCDWVQMLSRMYQRFAEVRGWKAEVLDFVDGDVAGLKSVTLKLTGPFAYGYCKSERGVHRLVRISPFDSNARRHTSFASVDVTPEIDESIDVEIRPEQIRIDTYRASGAGGQHVNKTDSAVRITHLPSGIMVSCQSERSQLQNKETCFKLLKAKLYEQELEARSSKLKEMAGEKKKIEWGSQIRSYVFQPYTLVKDARTKYEEGNIQAVMDGHLEGFITAYLKEFG
ncbi:MAG: peptide chain release factor 2 [Chlamydiota bacterium]